MQNATTLWMSGVDPSSQADDMAVLVECAATGDVSAFEEVLIRTERRVLLLAARILGNMDDAEDAAQEVFLRAFKYLHRFDRRRPFEPWLLRMTVNVCRDIARKRPVALERVPQEEEVSSSPDPQSLLTYEEQKQMVRNALQRLPAKERMAVVLRDLEGFSTAEVAEMLGSSAATVRAQLSSARIKIKKFISRLKRG
jgi:RNA polymerase sigma-70 factor (ECF subfamily)